MQTVFVFRTVCSSKFCQSFSRLLGSWAGQLLQGKPRLQLLVGYVEDPSLGPASTPV